MEDIIILTLKYFGIFLTGISIIGTRRLTNIERRIRELLRWASIERHFSRLREDRVVWRLFMVLLVSYALIQRLIFALWADWIGYFGYLITRERGLCSFIITQAIVESIIILLSLLGLLVLVGILNFTGEIGEEKWTFGRGISKVYGWAFKELGCTVVLIIVLAAPTLFLIALIYVLSQGILFALAKVLSIISWILSRPYVWLDMQVQQRKVESTLVVLGIIVAIVGETLDRCMK